MFAEGTTLDLYCDAENEEHGWDEFPHQFFAEGRLGYSTVMSRARREGWMIGREKQLCPKCSGKGLKYANLPKR